MQAVSFKIPDWGTKTCVVGTEWKEGDYNGKHYEHLVIHGIARKMVDDGKREIVVAEQFKVRKKMDLTIGDSVELIFNRFGQIEDVFPIKE